MAKSFVVRFPGVTRGFVGDDLLGDGGHWRGKGEEEATVFGDLGDNDARRWVRDDCFVAWVSGGRSARGRGGMDAVAECS